MEGTVEDFLVEASKQNLFSYRQINHTIDVKGNDGREPTLIVAEHLITVTGKVTDVNGEPLPGVTVPIPGITIGTATDLDGAYTLSVAEGSSLVFSFIGFGFLAAKKSYS